MRFIETSIAGAWLIELQPIRDDRGAFARVWCEDTFAARGLNGRFRQCNAAITRRRGTLRGLHYQIPPHEEVKLMRCVRGAIFDVIADLRPDSPTYLQWLGVELTADNDRMLYVPAGCAHGYQTLADDTEVNYPVTALYTASAERGIRWNDPVFAIQWPDAADRQLSPKDQQWPDFQPAAAAKAWAEPSAR
jgi:dTDP-4-dehydrorhamnose 3,5-epimerase